MSLLDLDSIPSLGILLPLDVVVDGEVVALDGAFRLTTHGSDTPFGLSNRRFTGTTFDSALDVFTLKLITTMLPLYFL
jgi:hypothetical protein